ncbi:unnamed protein product [Polarella glacialis]|nr:unnamed protein product [Polarella glacialis]
MSAGPGTWSLSSLELLQLLKELKASDLIPCICFHRSEDHLEQLLLAISERLEENEQLKLQESREERRWTRDQRKAAWQARLAHLKDLLAQAEENARARRTQQAQRKRSDKDEEGPAAQASASTEAPPPLREAKGGPSSLRVDGEPEVRARRAAVEAMGSEPPEEQQEESDFHFVAERPRHVYGVEIDMLLKYAEAGLKELGSKGKGMRWTQIHVAALRRGIAMHLVEEGCDGLNFAVQLLFRIGHVRVILAGEALGCGVNLPCRACVILDPEIQGAMLTQMAGRAGRRGLDLMGATVFVHDLATLRGMHTNVKGDA